MADFHPVCPKYSKIIERGHVPDASHGQVRLSSWAPGEPEVRRFVGGIKYHHPLMPFRCPVVRLLRALRPARVTPITARAQRAPSARFAYLSAVLGIVAACFARNPRNAAASRFPTSRSIQPIAL